MPKMKSNSAARKRFRTTGRGRLVHRKANSGHMKTKKSASRKRRLAQAGGVDVGDRRKVRRMVPYV